MQGAGPYRAPGSIPSPSPGREPPTRSHPQSIAQTACTARTRAAASCRPSSGCLTSSKAGGHLAPAMRSNAGFTLMELMIASAIGLLLLTGLAMIFVSTSEANRELQKSAQQIENGRYAIEIISSDLRMAGFYGHLHDMISITPKFTAAVPDPCEATSAALMLRAFWFPVQGFPGIIDAASATADAAPDLTDAPKCALLDAATLQPGSDVLVIRRADTNALATTAVATNNVFYVQASAINAEVQLGNGAVIGSTNKASGGLAALYLNNGAIPPPAAPISRLHTRIYFVERCSIGLGAGGVCTGAAGEDTIPTLKRLELTSSGTFT